MPGKVKLSKRELVDLIYETEQNGNDATELRKVLNEIGSEKVDPGEQKNTPEPEENTEVHKYALGLFVSGEVTDEMLTSMSEYDAKYSVSKLQKELEERQLSTVGQKHILCARLLADEKGWGKS